MSRHPNRRCETSVSSYEFFFQPDQRPQWQWFCEGCGAVRSGYATETAAEMDAANHTGLGEVQEDPDRIDWDALVREAEKLAAGSDGLPEWFTAGDLAAYERKDVHR
jgi:hypothetical protein